MAGLGSPTGPIAPTTPAAPQMTNGASTTCIANTAANQGSGFYNSAYQSTYGGEQYNPELNGQKQNSLMTNPAVVSCTSPNSIANEKIPSVSGNNLSTSGESSGTCLGEQLGSSLTNFGINKAAGYLGSGVSSLLGTGATEAALDSGAFIGGAAAIDAGATAATGVAAATAAGASGAFGGDAALAAVALSVICTELYNKGLLDEEIWEADMHFGASLPRHVVVGYHRWARPFTRLMRKNRWAMFIGKTVGVAWANEMASREGVRDAKPNLLGKFLLLVGVPICGFLGRQRTRSLVYAAA